MLMVSICPHCGKQQPAFDGNTVTCKRCGNVTQLQAATRVFLTKIEERWPNAGVILRRERVVRVIEKHDEYLKRRGDYDIITATLDENWVEGIEGADDDDADRNP